MGCTPLEYRKKNMYLRLLFVNVMIPTKQSFLNLWDATTDLCLHFINAFALKFLLFNYISVKQEK